MRPSVLAAGLACLAVLAGAPSAWAASDCSDPQSQQAMNACAIADWEQADRELNAEYKRARSFLVDADAELPADLKGAPDDLRDAQRAWIRFRDKACRAEAALFRGGTMEVFLFNDCRARLTRRRTEDLGFISE